MVALLAKSGHRILVARGGGEALEPIIAEQPDLVISDIMMPNLNGYQMVKQVRANTRIVQPHVILMTATYIEPEARAGVCF